MTLSLRTLFLHSTKAKYCGTNQGERYTKHVYIGSQRVVSKIGDLDSYGSDPHRIQYAGSETDGLSVDYKVKYTGQLQVIKDNYAPFAVPYYGEDNNDYVDCKGSCGKQKGTADKHLTFYVSLFCSDLDNKKQAISISTIVKYKNILGRIYFAAIWIFHWIIVHNLFRRAVKKWLSRDNITTTKD